MDIEQMPFERLTEFSILGIPQFDRPVEGAGRQNAPIR
jgi:hypothetical protein